MSAYEAESLSGFTDRVQWVDRGQVFKRIDGDGWRVAERQELGAGAGTGLGMRNSSARW